MNTKVITMRVVVYRYDDYQKLANIAHDLVEGTKNDYIQFSLKLVDPIAALGGNKE